MISMRPDIAREVIECMPNGRTLFHYSKDDYAFLLLQMMSKRENCIHKLRQTKARKLLEKPAVKPFLAGCADGILGPQRLPQRQHLVDEKCYRLSLDTWGGDRKHWHWTQVSRKGASLVLQMNLNRSEAEKLKGCYVSDGNDPFENCAHPTRSGEFPTLAWARLDFDLETGEALVEELQTDLIRDLQWFAEAAYEARKVGEKSFERCRVKFNTAKVISLWENDFAAERKHWQEAMLSAAIWFLVCEIGMRCIYYHTDTTGSFLKRITGTKPPKSLYTELPKRFCFDETAEVPQLLANERDWSRRVKACEEPLRFFRMAV